MELSQSEPTSGKAESPEAGARPVLMIEVFPNCGKNLHIVVGMAYIEG